MHRAVGPGVTQRVVDGAEHAQAQQVELDELHRLDIALVELDDDAAGHAGVLQGGDVDEGRARHQHAADMDGEVSRSAVDAGTQLQPAVPRRETDGRAATTRWQRVELDGADAAGVDAALASLCQ